MTPERLKELRKKMEAAREINAELGKKGFWATNYFIIESYELLAGIDQLQDKLDVAVSTLRQISYLKVCQAIAADMAAEALSKIEDSTS